MAAMLEKFTERSSRVIMLAQEEATALNHLYIEPGHVLLALLREGAGVASVALGSLGVSHSAVRSKVIEKASDSKQVAQTDLEFSPDTKRSLERSVGEAHRLGHSYVGTESILLALVGEPEGSAAQILVELGVDLNRIRWQITELLGSGGSDSSGSPHSGPPATQAGSGFFEKFTDRAKRVVVLARGEAIGLNHPYIGSEHMLLGLIREGAGVGARALESLNISLEAVRSQVEDSVGRGQQTVSGHIPFSSSTRQVLSLAQVEASELGHGYIGTEHILLGIIREQEGIGASVLNRLGADIERTRQRVVQLLAGRQPDSLPEPPVEAEPDRRRGEAVLPAESMATADLADHDVLKLLKDALREAQDAGDREVSGEHVLLAMFADTGNSGWLVLRWAGAGPRQFVAAAVRAAGNTAPHEDSVPLSDDLRQALEDGYRTARQPVSAAALLASLLRNQDAGATRTIAGAGMLPQDVLAAVVALARIGEIDAAAAEIADTGHPADLRSWRQPTVLTDAIRRETDDDAPGNRRDQWETPGWSGPDREAAISMFQFRLAAVSAAYLLVLVLALIALVDAATHGRLWLLLLVPLLGVGNPRFGTWSLVPLALLFWFLHLPVIAALVVAWIPLDAAMGALMLQRRHITEAGPQNRDDCRVGAAGIVAAITLGVRSWR